MEENKYNNGIHNLRIIDASTPFNDEKIGGIKYMIADCFPKVSKITLITKKYDIKDFATPLSKFKIIIERNSREETLELLEKIKEEIGRKVPTEEAEPTAIILEID